MRPPGLPSSGAGTLRRPRFSGLREFFPPARVTWIALVALAGYGVSYFGGLGVVSLVGLPIVAVVTDLAFQRVRFPEIRFPDGALATGAFLVLLFPPSAPLLFSGAVAVGAIGLKHVLRFRGRPFVNPAASGVVLGVLLFGLAPAWWVGVDVRSEIAMILVGAFVIARSSASWRLAPTFFLMFSPFSLALKLLFSAAITPKLLVLSILDPSTLFFGLYMVSEPRTAPRDPRLHPLYATLIAFGAVFLPLVMPSVGLLVALVIVGFSAGLLRLALTLRRTATLTATDPRLRKGRGSRSLPAATTRARARAPSLWTLGRRVSAAIVLIIMLGAVALSIPPSSSTPSVIVTLPAHSGARGGTGGSGAAGGGPISACTTDAASVPPATLQALHRALGPSVILSYDSSTGETVFYDPSNQVTVTETDLYEDYGFAEFNGDDFAVSGCSL